MPGIPNNNYPINQAAIDELIAGLKFVMDEPQLFTASGKVPKNPATSMARIPELELTQRAGGGMAAGMSDNMLKNPAVESRMRNVAQELQKAQIDKMLSQIDLNLPGPTPPSGPPPVPPAIQKAADIARRMNPVFMLLDLMTQSQPLNEGEDNQLKLKRLQSGTIDQPK